MRWAVCVVAVAVLAADQVSKSLVLAARPGRRPVRAGAVGAVAAMLGAQAHQSRPLPIPSQEE